MNWFKIANNDRVKSKIKDILKTHPFIKGLLEYYNISSDEIDNNLEIVITRLEGDFAKGNGKKIFLDEKLIDDNFFNDNFHFVVHEFFHWLKRRYESNFYFNDPEEIQSFVLAITWQLINGKSKEDIESSIYPIVKAHFKDDHKPLQIFLKMYEQAVYLSNIYKK
jgi:hypothetical protein